MTQSVIHDTISSPISISATHTYVVLYTYYSDGCTVVRGYVDATVDAHVPTLV